MLALTLAASAAISAALAGSSTRGGQEASAGWPRSQTRSTSTSDSAAIDWASVLDQLGRRRSLAWQQARPDQLDEVFLAGTDVLERDRLALRSYLRRSLKVDGAQVVFGRVVELRRFDAGDRVQLAVVDRLAPVEVWMGNGVVRRLPRDRATRHTLWLRRTADGWRISGVRSATH